MEFSNSIGFVPPNYVAVLASPHRRRLTLSNLGALSAGPAPPIRDARSTLSVLVGFAMIYLTRQRL